MTYKSVSRVMVHPSVRGAILLLESEIVAERAKRRTKLEAGLRRLADELEESIDHEIRLEARRLEAVRALGLEETVLETTSVKRPNLSAPLGLVKILADSGGGLTGAELTARARKAMYNKSAIEQGKQRAKDRKWIRLDEESGLWLLAEGAPNNILQVEKSNDN